MDNSLSICVESTKLHEGFKLKPYIDSEGNVTIGYGRNLTANPPTEEDESNWTVQRLSDIYRRLSFNTIFIGLSDIRKAVIAEMAYQMGIDGISQSNWKDMWGFLTKKDYVNAANAMLDSDWARKNAYRAGRLAYRMKNNMLQDT